MITSLADAYGMSDASAYRVIEMFLDAVDYNESCRAMQVRLPRSIDELNELTQRWCDVSTFPSNVDEDSSCSLQWMDFDSSLRDACVADIISSGIRRPRFNIDRNNES